MSTINLKTLYREATRALPADADLRVTVDELAALSRGESLGARHDAVVSALAVSSGQATAARIALATQAWADELAADLATTVRVRWTDRALAWFRAATLPPVFAACAISLLAVGAWRLSAPGDTATPVGAPAATADDRVFGGDFDEAIAHQSSPDAVFGGGFDS